MVRASLRQTLSNLPMLFSPDRFRCGQSLSQFRSAGRTTRRARLGLPRAMGLRICLVTPFAWSQPHDVNEHVTGVAGGLRALGHEVTVLAPSTRATALLAGRRALLNGAEADVIAIAPTVTVA